MKKTDVDEIIRDAALLDGNIKGEIILASLEDEGLKAEEINLSLDGSFMRPFRKDITSISCTEDKNGRIRLNISLSRNGTYDLLPEGLCHKQEAVAYGESWIKAFSKNYRQRKQEESDARKFFAPLENEMFAVRVNLEQAEHELYTHTSAFQEFLLSFWCINDVPDPYRLILARILPSMHMIAGNFRLICICLSEILKVEVSYKIEHRKLKLKSSKNANLKLGRNFTAGAFLYAIPFVVFKMEPVKQDRLQDFLPGGPVNLFLNRFFEYTIPLDAEYETKIISERFVKTENDPYFGALGYSASL